MDNDTLVAVTLAQCPIGLFMVHGELCLKTEYGNNEGRIDAYIVSSGEFFWGSHPQTIPNQRMQMVVPVDGDALAAALFALHQSEGRTGAGEALEERALAIVKAHYPEMPDSYRGRRYQIALAAIIATQEWAASVAESMFAGREWESARTNAGIIIGGYIRAGERDREATQ